MAFLFTQKQYKDIINFENFVKVHINGLNDSLSDEVRDYIFWNNLEAEAMELANQNTREPAKLKYVEPEPEPDKYNWWYNNDLFIHKKGEASWYLDGNYGRFYNVEIAFTEKEIDESPFKKDVFTKNRILLK